MTRDYAKENREYKSKPDQIKKRVARNKARRMMERLGKVKKGDGKAVDHKTPLSKGGSNTMSNLRVRDFGKNSSFPRNKDSSLKKNVVGKKYKKKKA
jgi:5-methylcytosine-specific restriction endonuclease McrA